MTELSLLKQTPAQDDLMLTVRIPGDEDGFDGVRCPHCSWKPAASSRWCCESAGSPEPAFQACGTVWNTFSTRGRCPGCLHQWGWTSCLRCNGWSLHEDWYTQGP